MRLLDRGVSARDGKDMLRLVRFYRTQIEWIEWVCTILWGSFIERGLGGGAGIYWGWKGVWVFEVYFFIICVNPFNPSDPCNYSV